MDKHSHNKPKIIGIAVLFFLISLMLIIVIEVIFKKHGDCMLISPGDLLAYSGGILAAIPTGVLSYLVYRQEKRAVHLEDEKSRPMLFLTELRGTEARPRDIIPKTPNFLSTIVTEGSPDFSYGIFLTDIASISADNRNARQYTFRFKFSGEIRCKQIQINKIALEYADNSKPKQEFDIEGQNSIFDAFENENKYVLSLYRSYSSESDLDWDFRFDLTLTTLMGEEYRQTIRAKKFMADEVELLYSVEYAT